MSSSKEFAQSAEALSTEMARFVRLLQVKVGCDETDGMNFAKAIIFAMCESLQEETPKNFQEFLSFVKDKLDD